MPSQRDLICAGENVKADGKREVKCSERNQNSGIYLVSFPSFLIPNRHPNVISYKESFFDDKENSLCIIMENADGGDLLNKI